MRIFILLKSLRLWSDSLKCWLTGRTVFFVRSLLCIFRRLWKGYVLEATNGTLRNVNNICILAINSAKYCVLFSSDLTGIRWRVLHMSTTYAAFVPTGVTLAYSCVRVWNFYPHQQVSLTVWLLFEGHHGRLRTVLYWVFERSKPGR